MEPCEDDPTDELGYLGLNQWHRVKQEQKTITEEEFVKYFKNEAALKHVVNTIRQIDRDHNGYVTRTELDDILKLVFREMADYNLHPIINKFSSISNKILIDYKQFQMWLRGQLLTKDVETAQAA